MMGERLVLQESLFYEFRLEDHVPLSPLSPPLCGALLHLRVARGNLNSDGSAVLDTVYQSEVGRRTHERAGHS
jgi:hypothetical protein